MNEAGEPGRKTETLRERISALSAAILRINATLDIDTVLGEVMESARGLTNARYGAIVDETGTTQDFVLSGLTAELEQELVTWPGRFPLFEHLRNLPGPLRLADLSDYVRKLGIAPAPPFSKSFQSVPMRHQGVQVGHFFLAEKERAPEFTDEDEEVLMVFASQAATPAPTAPSSAHARTLKPWWRPRRWASWSSTPATASRCSRTGKPSESSSPFARRAALSRSCSRC